MSDLAAIRERHHHFGMPESRRGICDACDLFAHIDALTAKVEFRRAETATTRYANGWNDALTAVLRILRGEA